LSAAPRIAEVKISMEGVDDGGSKVGGCCIATRELGLDGARSLLIESCSSLKIVASGTSYGIFNEGDAR
jgi:hypothetical protein